MSISFFSTLRTALIAGIGLSVQTVPEPSTLALTGVALLTAAFVARRRARQ
jgi:type III secretory pathway component EscR